MIVQDKTKIVMILDRSGSMESIISDCRGGANQFLNDQKKIDKPADLMIVQFDDQYELFYAGHIHGAPHMDETNYVPRGSTALLDAIGKTINTVGAELSRQDETVRPNQVIFVIMTDGLENASKEFSRSQIFDMIKRQREVYSWEFIFLAANQDAMKVAEGISIPKRHAVNFAPKGASARGVYGLVSSAVGSYRSRGSEVMSSSLDVDVDEKGVVQPRK